MEQQTIELIDIYDITYNPWWLSFWFKMTLVCVAASIAMFLSYYFYKKYRKKPIVPYWQHALDKINALRKGDFQDGQFFYVQLTDVLKQYLQERYQIHLVDKTDIEFLKTIEQEQAIPPVVYETLKDLLDGVMVIKFAHGKAVQERMNDALEQSIKLIENTKSEQQKNKK